MTPAGFWPSALPAVGGGPTGLECTLLVAQAADRWGSRLQYGAESGLETGPPSGRGGWGVCAGPRPVGMGGSPLSLRFGFTQSPQPHCTHSGAHPGGKVQKLFPEHSFWRKKKNSFAVQRPGSKYHINQARWHVPALLVRALTPGACHVTRASGASSCCCCGSPEEEAPTQCQTPAPLNRAAAPETPQTHWGF